MRILVSGVMVACLGLLTLLGGSQAAADKDDKKPAVEALPPHGLDAAFEAKNPAAAMANNPLFKKAMDEALKAKAAQQKRFDDNPKLRDATPAQAARKKFLEVLVQDGKAPGDKE